MKLKVRQVMTDSVVAVPYDSTVDHAISLLIRHRVSGLPVVDQDRRIVGVLSERDLLGLLLEPDLADAPVLDFATQEVMCVRPDDLLVDVVDIFRSMHIRRLPVVDEERRLVGLVSRHDLIRFIREVRVSVSGVLARRHEELAGKE